MFAALKTPGKTKIIAKKSRDHSELLFKNLNIPIKVTKNRNYDHIEINGLKNFRGFDYKVPGDISSCSFFIVLTLLSYNSKICLKNININNTRIGRWKFWKWMLVSILKIKEITKAN